MTEVAVWTEASSQHKNQSLDYNPMFFGMKITRDLGRASLM
jgi:hypothetical protein